MAYDINSPVDYTQAFNFSSMLSPKETIAS